MRLFLVGTKDSVRPLTALWSWHKIFAIVVIVVIQQGAPMFGLGGWRPIAPVIVGIIGVNRRR
jgi:hypothetical protein